MRLPGMRDSLVTVTVRQLADLVRGTVLGDGDLPIQSARTLQEARPGDITFVENDNYLSHLNKSQASAAVVLPHLPRNGKAFIQVADPLMAFVEIVQHLQGKPPEPPTGIDPRAVVHPSVQHGEAPSIHPLAVIRANTVIGNRCQIHSGAVIGKNCRLGDDVVIHPNVVLYDDCVLGDRVIVHANCVIGADGFGYRLQEGRHVKVPQLSNVIIGSDVEIGACSTVDRGAFQPTTIGDGTKIDNHVQVAHNCRIGKHNLFVAGVAVGGSCTTADHVTLAGQAGIKDHVAIGEGAIVCARTGVGHDLDPGEIVFGNPSRPLTTQKRVIATMDKLPEIRRDVQRLKKHLGLPDEK
jgi:UDP-3-O-[3-hydroxymyristoyl] glucosamine N-acyltransferase